MKLVPAPQGKALTRIEALFLGIYSYKRNTLTNDELLKIFKQIENDNGIVYTKQQIVAQAKQFKNLIKFFCNDVDSLSI